MSLQGPHDSWTTVVWGSGLQSSLHHRGIFFALGWCRLWIFWPPFFEQNDGSWHLKVHLKGCPCSATTDLGMDQYLLIPFLVGWTSIYQLFWGSLGTRVLTHPHLETHGFDDLVIRYMCSPWVPKTLVDSLSGKSHPSHRIDSDVAGTLANMKIAGKNQIYPNIIPGNIQTSQTSIYPKIYIYIDPNGGFLKWGVLLNQLLKNVFHYKLSMWGYPHLWKPANISK